MQDTRGKMWQKKNITNKRLQLISDNINLQFIIKIMHKMKKIKIFDNNKQILMTN